MSKFSNLVNNAIDAADDASMALDRSDCSTARDNLNWARSYEIAARDVRRTSVQTKKLRKVQRLIEGVSGAYRRSCQRPKRRRR